MAKLLSPELIDTLHTALETQYVVDVEFTELYPYYSTGEYTNHRPPDIDEEVFDYRRYIVLLILAAEEELDGYPMEASNEIS